MPNALDPYREALVVEHHTIWPNEYEDYVRQHTGFARVITVTPVDLERVSVA